MNGPEPKVVATLKAKAALQGVVLSFMEDDRGAALFVASKWADTRQMHTAAEVEQFLAELELESAQAG